MNNHARLLKLEQRNKPSDITSYVKDGFRYVGGKLGFLRVPVPQTEQEWLAAGDKTTTEGVKPRA